MMRKKTVVVHCVYADKGKTISELLEESFRLYLSRILAEYHGNKVSCP